MWCLYTDIGRLCSTTVVLFASKINNEIHLLHMEHRETASLVTFRFTRQSIINKNYNPHHHPRTCQHEVIHLWTSQRQPAEKKLPSQPRRLYFVLMNQHHTNPPIHTHTSYEANRYFLLLALLLSFLEPIVAAGVAQHSQYQLWSVLLAESFRLACADGRTP